MKQILEVYKAYYTNHDTGAGILSSLDQEGDSTFIDDAYESLQLSSMPGDEFLSMGAFSTMPSMGEFPYPSQLPVITESPPPLSEIVPQADGTPHGPNNTQDGVNDGSHSNPMPSSSDADSNHSGQAEHIVEKNCNFNENAHSNVDVQGHSASPMHSEESVMNPQLPSTTLSKVRSQPIEIPLRQPVKQKLDYVLERVLVENKV